MFSVAAIAILLCSIKHDLYDYNYDYTSARSSSSIANPLTGCYSCLKVNHAPVKHWDINKNVDSSLILKTWMNFSVQYKTVSQYFACYKNWFGFYAVIKTKSIYARYKIKSIFSKELQKPNRFLWLLQKPSWFLQRTKTELIFSK